MRYYRLAIDDGSRLVASDDDRAYDLTSVCPELASFIGLPRIATVMELGIDAVAERLVESAEIVDLESISDAAVVPVAASEVWAAGVTHEISDEAREAESGRPDVYSEVYESERPELFFKATPSRTVGPGEAVGIRGDSEGMSPNRSLASSSTGGKPSATRSATI